MCFYLDFVGFVILILLWSWLSYGKTLFRRPATFVFLVLVCGGLLFSIDFMLNETWMGKRFQKDFIEKQDSFEDQRRIIAYQDGLEVIRMNPFIGVGLDNFRYHTSTQMHSHSDYIEVAATTGIIGAIIYFSIYIVLWQRLRRIQTSVENSSILHDIGLIKAIIITKTAQTTIKITLTTC